MVGTLRRDAAVGMQVPPAQARAQRDSGCLRMAPTSTMWSDARLVLCCPGGMDYPWYFGLACVVQLLFIPGVAIYTWRQRGGDSGDLMALTTFSFVTQLLEFALYKRQAPPLGGLVTCLFAVVGCLVVAVVCCIVAGLCHVACSLLRVLWHLCLKAPHIFG
jgi:hypothetical protein